MELQFAIGPVESQLQRVALSCASVARTATRFIMPLARTHFALTLGPNGADLGPC